MSEMQVRGTIAVFAKCPIAGSSKTRLSSLLGEDGAADLAKAMLSDILYNISNYVSHLFVLSTLGSKSFSFLTNDYEPQK